MIIVTAGYLLKVSLSDMLPFTWSGLIVVLYVLSFGRILNAIDFILPGIAVAGIICVWKKKDPDRALVIPDAGAVAYLVLCIVLPIALHARVVTWWDDINYWASDLKSLYFLGGFARKYANVSAQFGDYPPGVQLAKWFLVHMDRHVFREDLAFVGYYLFNLSFMAPLFSQLKGKRAWIGLLIAPFMWAFAGIGEIYGYNGFCADLSMAFLFGSVLVECVRNDIDDDRTELLSTVRTSLYLAVLVIAKSTGFIWAFFGVIIWVVSRYLKKSGGSKLKPFAVCIGPVITGGSWMAFCLVRHRVAQTTSTMVTYVTTDQYGVSAYTSDFAKALIKAFFTEPLHLDRTWIDLPPAFMLALMIILFALICRRGLISGKAGRFACIALPVMGVIYYGVIFIAHITMFATETQYLEPSGMAASIERYGAPFVIGCMLLISYVWLKTAAPENEIARLRIFFIAVLALTNVPAAFNGIIGYRSSVQDEIQTREAFIEEDSAEFLDTIRESSTVSQKLDHGGVRICRFRDGAYYRVADTYVSYEASPVSLLCPSAGITDIDEQTFVKLVNETHAELLYVDEQPYTDTYLDKMAESGSFDYKRLYSIGYDEGMMKLYPVD